ncbi:MAG: Gfo/Idh/MocA family oxidoreductase [Kiritimatiellae bacterium]|nr:Gfo/Idh/MocA family oxidoreductase [Kiritimatiellia bacterium]
MNRRSFIRSGLALGAAGALPIFNIGCAGFGCSRGRQIAKGAKIRVALLGCGWQTHAMIDGVLCEDLVAIVDPDPARIAWLSKYVGDTCDAEARANFAKARRFSTYQDLFEKMGDELDAIVVETPNHQHVLPAVMAIRRGIHVYLDKPLCLTAAEGDLLLEETRKMPGVVTQCGTYGHSFPSMKYCVDRIREGALGEVKEVWAYDDRCNSIYARPAATPPPKGMDWDLWCGGSPLCDYYPESEDQDGMHPHGWHSWIGYGNGSIGNLGMHIMDVAFWALGLKDPDKVTCHDAKFALEGAWAYRDAMTFHFPKSAFGEVDLHWWDGLNDGVPYKKEFVNRFGHPHKREWLNIPPRVKEIEKEEGFADDPFHANGVVFIGTKGKLWFTHHGGYRFMPRKNGWCMPRVDRPNDFNYRIVTPHHFKEFYAAIREGREANDCFEYSVPLAKTVCLGNISALAGTGSVLTWDGHHVTNNEKANEHVTKSYRNGWNPFV